MPPVDVRVPLYVDVATPQTVIVFNNGNVGIYFQIVASASGTTISSTTNDGTVNPGGSLFVNAPTYFLAAGPGAQVDVQETAATQGYAPGLVLSDGTQVLADFVATITGDPADDTGAISAGTNLALPVDLLTAGALGNVSGTVQVSLAGGDAQYTGIILTGNATFSILNAIPASVLALDVTANGNTITHPTGTIWPNNTPPTPSGATDSYVYRVAAVNNNGVPTKLYGAFLQGYPS